MAATNHCCSSTKCYDAETDLVYYGLRYYNPSTGRWLNRDPIGEEGGLNVYSFTGNNGISFYDLLGLDWNLDRQSNRDRAHAKPQSGDTVSDLAKKIGFDDKDYRKWLKPVGPSRLPNSASEAITDCAEFTVPNIIYIEFGEMFGFADPHGQIPTWKRHLTQLGSQYESNEGFQVIINRSSSPSEAKAHLEDHNIHGFAYAGHGGGEEGTAVGLLVFKRGERSGTALDGRRFTKHGISFMRLYACASASRYPQPKRMQQALGWKYSPWEVNVSTRGKFIGMWGNVRGWPIHTAYGHLVETEGTNQ